MRWQGESEATRKDRFWNWHTVFAWLPIQTMGGEWVWLEKVYRKRESRGFNGLWYFIYLPSVRATHEYDRAQADRRERMRQCMPSKR